MRITHLAKPGLRLSFALVIFFAFAGSRLTAQEPAELKETEILLRKIIVVQGEEVTATVICHRHWKYRGPQPDPKKQYRIGYYSDNLYTLSLSKLKSKVDSIVWSMKAIDFTRTLPVKREKYEQGIDILDVDSNGKELSLVYRRQATLEMARINLENPGEKKAVRTIEFPHEEVRHFSGSCSIAQAKVMYMIPSPLYSIDVQLYVIVNNILAGDGMPQFWQIKGDKPVRLKVSVPSE